MPFPVKILIAEVVPRNRIQLGLLLLCTTRGKKKGRGGVEDNTTDCLQQCCKDLKGSDQVLEIKTNSMKVFFSVEAKL